MTKRDIGHEARRMVAEQIEARGVSDARVLEAMRRVPRHRFVDAKWFDDAYADKPLPIGNGQTISQPYIVALMAESLALQGDETVLEIGTGCGYAAAVLAELAARVYTVERHSELARHAKDRLHAFGYQDRITVIEGDGSLGHPSQAPYEAISVAAGAPQVPNSLKEQLTVDGRLVIPVEEAAGDQWLLRITRVDDDDYEEERLTAVRFVPLIGAEGWQNETPD